MDIEPTEIEEDKYYIVQLRYFSIPNPYCITKGSDIKVPVNFYWNAGPFDTYKEASEELKRLEETRVS